MTKLKISLASIRGLGAGRLKLLSVLTVGHFFIHWFQQFYPVVLPSVKAGLGLNDVQVGALNSARQFIMGALDLPLGMLADSAVRYRGLILASALLSMGSAYLLMGAAPVFFWALVGSALVGLGTSLWHPAATASLSNRFPERRATAIAIHGMGATIGDTLTPIGVGFLLVTFPWQIVLEMQIVPALLLGLLVLRGLAGLFADSGAHSSRAAQVREIVELAKKIYQDLRGAFACVYDDTAAIGKLYRRQDEVGTLFCLTVDVQSLEDRQVTVRDRDTMKQERISIDKLKIYFNDKL